MADFTSFLNSNKDKVLKRRNLKTLCLEVVLLLASAFLLALSFPGAVFKDGIGFLAFIALIPLFAVIRNTNYKTVWFYGFLFGFVFYWIFNYWLAAFHPLANLLVQVIKGTEMILLFVALKAADRCFNRKISFLVQTLIWISYAYLSQNWFAGYPYGTIAYSVFKYKLLIQIVDITGIWGLIFMMVLPQAFIGQYLARFFSTTKEEHCESVKENIKDNKVMVIIFLSLFVIQLLYGVISYSKWEKAEPDTSFKVVTVQHNADSWKGGFKTYETNFHNLSRMSLESLSSKPDLIVWSETAFVPSVDWYTNYPYEGKDQGPTFDYLRDIQVLVDEFVTFGTKLGVPLLTGNPSGVLKEGVTSPYTEDGDWNKTDYNSVILFDDGEIKGSYRKQHLVPFTEHFPYEKQMPWLYNLLLANDYNWWEEGTESKVFTTSNGITFSTPICFEDIFGELCAKFVDNGADLLINMTNDSWSGSVAAERQHMAMAVFRAVENRRTMLRGTNSGITCLIKPSGKITGEMKPFTATWKAWDVPVYSSKTYGKTVYTTCQDTIAKVVVYVSYALLAFGVASEGYKKIKKHGKKH